ncbi:hypothetical protein [Actinoallomurus sp. CA-150999]
MLRRDTCGSVSLKAGAVWVLARTRLWPGGTILLAIAAGWISP